MLELLGLPLLEPDAIELLRPPSPTGADGPPLPHYLRESGGQSDRPPSSYRSQTSSRQPYSTRMKFHFFSFQVNHVTGFMGHS